MPFHRRRHRRAARDGKVTFEKELNSSSSYFQMRNLGAYKDLAEEVA